MAALDQLADELERSYGDLQDRMADPSVYADHREAAELGRRLNPSWDGAFARIEIANSILRHYGLKLGDFEGRTYVLRSATGRQELVPHLPSMWVAAERLGGRACDPLDPALIAALED